MVECFPCRRFDRRAKALRIDGCVHCGKCLRLNFCMGWRHRFWRRIIVEDPDNAQPVSGTPAPSVRRRPR
jgi:hypothetical protein